MVKVSVNRFVSTRVKTIRNEVKAETQRLREKTLEKLKEIFNVAARVARGEIEHQRIKGRLQHRRKRNPRAYLFPISFLCESCSWLSPNLWTNTRSGSKSSLNRVHDKKRILFYLWLRTSEKGKQRYKTLENVTRT